MGVTKRYTKEWRVDLLRAQGAKYGAALVNQVKMRDRIDPAPIRIGFYFDSFKIGLGESLAELLQGIVDGAVRQSSMIAGWGEERAYKLRRLREAMDGIRGILEDLDEDLREEGKEP
jgi:hypothetical protein